MTRRAAYKIGTAQDSRATLGGDDHDPLIYVGTSRRGSVHLEHDRLVGSQGLTLEDIRRFDAEDVEE